MVIRSFAGKLIDKRKLKRLCARAAFAFHMIPLRHFVRLANIKTVFGEGYFLVGPKYTAKEVECVRPEGKSFWREPVEPDSFWRLEVSYPPKIGH